MSRVEHTFSEQKDLIAALSERILEDLQNAIDTKGKASLLVSGGSTPKPLFEKFSKSVFTWEKVSIGLCDERWIETSSPKSNEHFVNSFLLKGEAAKANFIGMYEDGKDIYASQKVCSQKMQDTLASFDVVILGMGSDAHTASLFPENERLEEAFDMNNPDLCIAIEPDTAPFSRMSLTLQAILSAEHIYLHFEGEEKIAVYEEAKSGEDVYKMPIRSVINQTLKKVEVFYR